MFKTDLECDLNSLCSCFVAIVLVLFGALRDCVPCFDCSLQRNRNLFCYCVKYYDFFAQLNEAQISIATVCSLFTSIVAHCSQFLIQIGFVHQVPTEIKCHTKMPFPSFFCFQNCSILLRSENFLYCFSFLRVFGVPNFISSLKPFKARSSETQLNPV